MIYFWNDKQLARDLKNGAVSEWHKFIYLMLYFYVPMLGRSLSALNPKHAQTFDGGWMLLLILVGVPIGIFFFYILYKINAKGDGLHFIERYICLTFPLIVRFTVIGLPLMLLAIFPFIFIFKAFGLESRTAGMLCGAIVGITFMVLYYLRMIKLLKIASGQMD